MVGPSPLWGLAGAGALAAATADTWATELGTRFGGTPRHLLTLRNVPAGTSGGVSVTGLVASVLGASLLGVVAATWSMAPYAPVVLAGVGGAIADSILGATVQERRHCDSCDMATERRVHHCGSRTRINGGLAGINNDVVNFLSTIAGGVIAALSAGTR